MTPLAPNPCFHAKGAQERGRGKGRERGPRGTRPPLRPRLRLRTNGEPRSMQGQRGRAWPRTPPFTPTFAQNGGPGRRTSRAGDDWEGVRARRGMVGGHARTGGVGRVQPRKRRGGPLLFSRFTRRGRANEGWRGNGKSATLHPYARAPVRPKRGARGDPRHPAQVAAQGRHTNGAGARGMGGAHVCLFARGIDLDKKIVFSLCNLYQLMII
ncbi:hypothetical protein H4582DRAFT_2060195 [Lactarius indigo]|nr:hypothetical protein H4582DRAFT_2060195 [Lactarius indigo]